MMKRRFKNIIDSAEKTKEYAAGARYDEYDVTTVGDILRWGALVVMRLWALAAIGICALLVFLCLWKIQLPFPVVLALGAFIYAASAVLTDFVVKGTNSTIRRATIKSEIRAFRAAAESEEQKQNAEVIAATLKQQMIDETCGSKSDRGLAWVLMLTWLALSISWPYVIIAFAKVVAPILPQIL